MSKPRSARGAKHSSNNAIDLAAEAASMELKLLELKRAMDKEREKREVLTTKAHGDFLWQNGSSGLLRGKFRTQQTAAAAGAAGHADTGGTHPASSKAGGHGHGHGAPAAAAGHAPPFRSPRQDAAPSPPPPAHHRPAQQPPPAEQPSISGSRITAPPERAAAASRSGSSSARRTADVLAVHHDTHEAVEGMGCGTEAGDGLADGHFNEGDSHKSFLEALNEWRRGSKAPEDEAASAVAPAAGRPSSSRPAAHAPGVVMEVQTEARPAAAAPRPSSAKPISFFDKLVISENSRHAGDAADGTAVAGSKGGGSSRSPAAAAPSSSRPSSAATAVASSATAGAPLPPAAPKKGQVSLADAPEQPADGTGGTPPAPAADDKLAMLARLEALERAQQQDDDDDEEDDGGPRVAVLSSHTGRGLTKGTRLPDNIIVPESDPATASPVAEAPVKPATPVPVKKHGGSGARSAGRQRK